MGTAFLRELIAAVPTNPEIPGRGLTSIILYHITSMCSYCYCITHCCLIDRQCTNVRDLIRPSYVLYDCYGSNWPTNGLPCLPRSETSQPTAEPPKVPLRPSEDV